jgi:hypothetical protein
VRGDRQPGRVEHLDHPSCPKEPGHGPAAFRSVRPATVRPAMRRTVRVGTLLDDAAPAGGFPWHSGQAASPGRSNGYEDRQRGLPGRSNHEVRTRERRLKETMT